MRSLEARRRDTPVWIAGVQMEMIERMAQVATAAKLPGLLPELINLLRRRLNNLRSGRVPLEDLLVVQPLGVDQEQLEAWVEGGYAVSLPCMQC